MALKNASTCLNCYAMSILDSESGIPSPFASTAPALRKAVAKKAPTKKIATTAAKTHAKPGAPDARPRAPTAKTKVLSVLPETTKTSGAHSTKDEKSKLVPDGFTIPRPKYLVPGDLRLRTAGLKFPVK